MCQCLLQQGWLYAATTQQYSTAEAQNQVTKACKVDSIHLIISEPAQQCPGCRTVQQVLTSYCEGRGSTFARYGQLIRLNGPIYGLLWQFCPLPGLGPQVLPTALRVNLLIAAHTDASNAILATAGTNDVFHVACALKSSQNKHPPFFRLKFSTLRPSQDKKAQRHSQGNSVQTPTSERLVTCIHFFLILLSQRIRFASSLPIYKCFPSSNALLYVLSSSDGSQPSLFGASGAGSHGGHSPG